MTKAIRAGIAALFALAMIIAAPVAWAVSSSVITIASDQWYDLGAGPMIISATQSALFRVDDAQPNVALGGAPINVGYTDANQPVNTTSHVWARTNGNWTANVIVMPQGGGTANPPSTLTLPATTTAYTAGQLIATGAAPVSVPSFAAPNFGIARLRLSTNDTTSTAWGAQTITVDLWSAAPTFTNGDRGAWALATGAASHLGAFSCTMSAEYGDGAYAECAPAIGTVAVPKFTSGNPIYWTLNATTGSGVTGATKVFTLTPEEMN